MKSAALTLKIYWIQQVFLSFIDTHVTYKIHSQSSFHGMHFKLYFKLNDANIAVFVWKPTTHVKVYFFKFAGSNWFKWEVNKKHDRWRKLEWRVLQWHDYSQPRPPFVLRYCMNFVKRPIFKCVICKEYLWRNRRNSIKMVAICWSRFLILTAPLPPPPQDI